MVLSFMHVHASCNIAIHLMSDLYLQILSLLVFLISHVYENLRDNYLGQFSSI